METKRLSLVVPTHQRPRALRRLLVSLEGQSLPKTEFEILVARNLYEDEKDLTSLQERLPLRWLHTGKLGINYARNAGVDATSGNIVLFLDDDEFVDDRDLLKKHCERHELDPGLDGLGGAFAFPEELSDFSFAYHLQAMAWLDRYRADDGSTPYLIGGHSSYKRRVFREFRFSDRITFGGSESEFNLQLYRAGKRLEYHPDLRVLHYSELSGKQLMRKAYMQGFHGRQRKSALGLPQPVRKHRHAVERVLKAEKIDRSRKIGTRIAGRLFDYSYQLGWKDAERGQGRFGKAFAAWVGAKGV